MRLAASRTNAAHQFTNRPLMNSVCPPRCPLHSPGLTCMRACHVASCWRRVHHRDRHQHTIPIALAALPGAILPATSCLDAFWTPASSARRAYRRCRRPKTSTKAVDQGCSRGRDQTSSAAHGPHTAIIFLQKEPLKMVLSQKNAKTLNRISKLVNRVILKTKTAKSRRSFVVRTKFS
jgi:hypothetical protein